MKLQEVLNEAAAKEEKSEGQLVRDWFKTRVSMATGKVANREKLEDAVKITPGGKASIATDITAVYVDFTKTAPTKKSVPPPVPLQKLFKSRHKLRSVDYRQVPKELLNSDLLINAHCVGFKGCDLPKLSTFAPILTEIVGISIWDATFEGGLLGLFKYPKLQWVVIGRMINGKDYDIPTSRKVEDIMKKHLSSAERDVADCMEELMDAGFKEFAKP